MPQIDGLSFLQRLRAVETHRTPVVIMTGDYFVDESTATSLHALGAEIRFKPLWVDDLLDATRTLIASHGSEDVINRSRAHECVQETSETE
jgi:DNA-binding response OmpR family regulator